MDINIKLTEIWNKFQNSELPETIIKRGFNHSINNGTKDILITGINPSFRKDENEGNCCFDFNDILNDSRYDIYWTPLKKMLKDETINLLGQTSYLDILYFREKEQKILTKSILSSVVGLSFIAEQLNVTQNTIENVIQPKLIIVKNKESGAYWGKFSEKGIIWMGYELEFLETTISGELYKIKGLINSHERIAPEITKTNLENSLILFSVHINQYTKKDRIPTPKFIEELLKRVKNKSN